MLARLILILVIAVTVSACFTEPSSPTVRPTLPTAGPVSTFSDDIMSFEYPSTWNAAKLEYFSSMSRLIVYLSTSPLSEPCESEGNAVTCGMPVDQLEPDGVLVSWFLYELPGPAPSPIPNPSAVAVEIGGRPATVTQEVPSSPCADIGGEQELYARIDVPNAPGNYVEMDACVRGPNFELTGAVIAAMLVSVEWKI